MARRLRNDCPGAEFHVMSRGIARRTIFDTPADYRFFLSCLARAVRRGEIVVLAYRVPARIPRASCFWPDSSGT